MSYIHRFTRRIAHTTTLALVTVLALTASLYDRAATRGKDKGDVVQTVIIIAGLATLAIAVVAWIGPVVQRYLTQIR